MSKYCRLCAESKESCEIVASIDWMEQKLRECCQWTDENTKHQLPHGVCSICWDNLERCWLFSQRVQLKQLRLLKIFDTKPLAVEMCSVNLDRQQGSEGLIETESISVDCKPEVMDFATESGSDMDMGADEIQAGDDDDSSYIAQPSTKAKRVVKSQPKPKGLVQKNANEASQHNAKDKKSQQIDQKASKKRFHCDFCDKDFGVAHSLTQHIRHKHADDCPFKCQLCVDSYKDKAQFSAHLVMHVRSSEELKIEEINNKLCIIRTNGGDPIEIPSNISIFKAHFFSFNKVEKTFNKNDYYVQ